MPKWTSDESAVNCIDILRGEEVVAQVVEDDELTEGSRAIAQFIVEACNEKEARA